MKQGSGVGGDGADPEAPQPPIIAFEANNINSQPQAGLLMGFIG